VFSVPPGYARTKPPLRPKFDKILSDDESQPKKQKHASKRLFERLT
jgi:hypothetical protein